MLSDTRPSRHAHRGRPKGLVVVCRRTDRFVWLLIVALGVSGVSLAAGPRDRTADEAILDLLLWGRPPTGAERSSLTPDVRTRVDAHLERLRRFRSLQTAPRDASAELRMVHHAHVNYERRLAIASADPRAPAEAAAYVAALRPCYEWEGFHDCPEREALFADQYQTDHPDGPLTAFLPLLAAHRWLCSAEAYGFERQSPGAIRSRRMYEERLAQIQRADDPLIRAAAEGLARRHTCLATP